MSNQETSLNEEMKNLSPSMFEPAKDSDTSDKEKIVAPSLNFFQDSWRRLKKNKAAVVSLFILILMIGLSIAAPVISPQNPNKQTVAYANLPPRIPGININGLNGTSKVGNTDKRVDKYKQKNVPDNVNYYFGTDGLGRDLLSRILAGTRVSLMIAFIAAFFDLTIGVSYGLISGMNGGRIDNVMQRILEVISGIPNIVVLILMLLVLQPGIMSIVLAMAITGWITMARVVRAQTLKLKNQEYILAAKTLGESNFKIAVKHLIPNLSGVIIINTMFTIPAAIFFEAFLSFIGIGIPAPQASLGTLLSDGYKTFRFLPHLMWYPAAVMCILMISFNLLADGLRDAFDPKMKD
ncbi:oligopeptide ABC transporter permease [Carnobacterium gallinarum]|uniref:oligopeptide ABC transporter permease n=1 Tax=Carnobacterium gallinarum TaxID=2749 RepID=UPI00055529BD|nr:oligopeptide ABC transporter permease [Carnobacterium gallinarum]